jgi:hypothetical protein
MKHKAIAQKGNTIELPRIMKSRPVANREMRFV